MTQTDISPSLISRITQAARYVINGVTPDTWFGPMQPLAPMAPPDAIGRRFDYPTGYNLSYTPRSYESITFEDLRALADNCDILRSVIETRKDQMEALEWAVRVSPSLTSATVRTTITDDQKRRIDLITQFLHSPDKEHSFAGWLRQLLEDMFVIDAACLYKRRSRAGGLYALEIIDGATIKILLDENGRLPMPPDPAYQQVLKGVPASDYTREELMYIKHNPRSHKVYGYSHVEQVLVTVNILLRRAMHQLEYYRDGSVPDAFIGLPKEWNQDQISAFQKHFDAMISGNLGARRKVRFMSGDFKYQETKQPPLKDAYDEFLARIICFVFSVSPEPFVGQVNRATAQTSHSRAIDEGLAPLQRFVRGIVNRVIKTEFASPDLEFVWQDTREQDPQEAAQIDVAYVEAGIKTVNEVRAGMGLMPIVAPVTAVVETQKKTLKSGALAKDDSDDEDDDESDDDSDDDDDFETKHPRWPAGSPGSVGGEFAPKDASTASPDSDHGSVSADDVKSDVTDGAGDSVPKTVADAGVPDASVSSDRGNISVDQIRNAIIEGMDDGSSLPPGVQVAADSGIESDAQDDNLSTWGDPDTLQNHLVKHAEDFGIDPESPDATIQYVQKANQFYIQFQTEGLPAIQYPNGGEIGVYDPATNTFAVYNADGTTQTFYKPTSPTYFEREIEDVLSRGGKIINPLPTAGSQNSSGGSGGVPLLGRPKDLLNSKKWPEEND